MRCTTFGDVEKWRHVTGFPRSVETWNQTKRQRAARNKRPLSASRTSGYATIKQQSLWRGEVHTNSSAGTSQERLQVGVVGRVVWWREDVAYPQWLLSYQEGPR